MWEADSSKSLIMIDIIVTNMVTCDYVVIHILQNDAEIR